MAEAAKKKKAESHWWWFESHNSSATAPKRSPWLQSTLAELDEKTKAMLRIIEEDADSFAKRAEMYYKKRPELITMIEEFYRAHRSLAERYELLKSESGPRAITPWSSSPVPFKYPQVKSITFTEKSYDSFSENYDHMDSGESEVDDPELDEEEEVEDLKEEVGNYEVMKLKEEIERLKEENKNQKQQIEEKDEEKREVIRQLSVAMDVLKEENVKMRKHIIAKETPKKSVKSPTSTSEFNKLKGMFLGKLFSGSPISKASVIAL